MKKSLSLFLALLLAVLLLPVSGAGTAPLTFRADGTFRILQLSDTQDDAYPAPAMLRLLRDSIAFAEPDLIVISGDLVEDHRAGDVGVDARPLQEGVVVTKPGGEMDLAATRRNVETAIDAVLSEIEAFGVPYVIALGNNDRKVGLSGQDWVELLSAYPHCIFFDESPDAADGIDYHVSIRDAAGDARFNLWLMDTCRGGISDEQVDWYRAASAAATAENGGVPVPALAFQHIQCADIGNLFEPCSIFDEGAKRVENGFVRLNRDVAKGYSFYGYAPGAQSYEFSAWKACGDVLGAFFGHQHVEGISGVWDGIELGFTYGCEMAKPGPYGFRLFTLHADDLTHYDNTLYRYNTALRGAAAITPEPETAYADVSGPLGPFIRLRSFFSALISAIVSLFA